MKNGKSNKFIKRKFTINVTYKFEQGSSNELQEKKASVHYFQI